MRRLLMVPVITVLGPPTRLLGASCMLWLAPLALRRLEGLQNYNCIAVVCGRFPLCFVHCPVGRFIELN